MASPVDAELDWCVSCGNDLRAKARFCDACGTPVARPATVGEHKQITVLFADVVGSMKLAATLDAERLQELMNELFNRAAAVVQRYQGTVDKFTGDGLMALFGAPMALEDHALRACIAALEIQSVADDIAATVRDRDGIDLRLRVGVNSGAAVVGEIGLGPGRYTAVGHPVGMAQRMEAAAPTGGVLCSLSTAHLVADVARLAAVEDVAVKGSETPVPARRLLGVEFDQMVVGRNEGTMLGRDAELQRLRDVLDAGGGCTVGVVGGPGLGKSRLVAEFGKLAADRGAEIVVARCESHTTALAFRALARVLRALFSVAGRGDGESRERVIAQCDGLLDVHSADAQILFDAMGIADPQAPPLQVNIDGRRRRLVDVMVQVLRRRTVPTVFILEDAHWIDEPSDDVLAEFGSALAATTSMLLTTYRPERHGALQRKSSHTLVLRPLAESTAVRLVAQILGDDPSLTGLAQRIADAAAGNPFFAEEIVRDLAGRALLSGSRGRYRLTGDVAQIEVPATIQAVLAARIDRLSPDAKSLLNAAAVIGNRFDVDTLQALLPQSASLPLAELVSAELIDQTEFLPRQRYCFHHPLVRTVAYESQLSSARAGAHRRLAASIEAGEPGAAEENAALIATHLEAAGEFADAHRWHLRAANWLRPRDLAAARAQWERARVIADELPDHHDGVIAMRIAPLTMLMSTLLYVAKDVSDDDRYREMRLMTAKTGDWRSFAIGTAGQIWSFSVNDFRVPEAAALATELEQLADGVAWDAGARGIVLNAIAYARFVNCELDAARRAADAILAMAPDVPAAEIAPARALRGVIEMCLGNHEVGRQQLREGTDQARGLPPVNFASVLHYAVIMTALGMCPADDLVDDTDDALRRAESFGDLFGLTAVHWAYGTIALRAQYGSRRQALEALQRAREGLRRHRLGNTIMLATIEADLAVEAARTGRRDEAIEELRSLLSQHVHCGSRMIAGRLAEVLVELLVERGAPGDLAEAHRIVDLPQARHPGIPAMDLWWLRSGALLAKAEGDVPGHADLAGRYLALCEKLDARGRLDEARRMVDGCA